MTTDLPFTATNPVDDRYNPPACGELDEIAELLADGRLSGGAPVLPAYEQALAAGSGSTRAIAVNSGSSALHATLIALGVKPDSEVLVPATAPLATAMPILTCGATPVIVDTLPGCARPRPGRRRGQAHAPHPGGDHACRCGATRPTTTTQPAVLLADGGSAAGRGRLPSPRHQGPRPVRRHASARGLLLHPRPQAAVHRRGRLRAHRRRGPGRTRSTSTPTSATSKARCTASTTSSPRPSQRSGCAGCPTLEPSSTPGGQRRRSWTRSQPAGLCANSATARTMRRTTTTWC